MVSGYQTIYQWKYKNGGDGPKQVSQAPNDTN